MKISHRQNVAQRLVSTSFDKAPRLSCCCRLSELMPLVRQLHDAARAQADARLGQESQQAA